MAGRNDAQLSLGGVSCVAVATRRSARPSWTSSCTTWRRTGKTTEAGELAAVRLSNRGLDVYASFDKVVVLTTCHRLVRIEEPGRRRRAGLQRARRAVRAPLRSRNSLLKEGRPRREIAAFDQPLLEAGEILLSARSQLAPPRSLRMQPRPVWKSARRAIILK
jgi:hypothetical protein